MMLFVFAVSTLFSFVGKVQAAAACESKVAQIVSVQGIVELRRAGQTVWQQVAMDMELCPGDMLRVRARSRAALRLSNDSMLRLDQKTIITFPELAEDKATSLVDLFTGALHILTRTPKPFKIRTPFVNAAVEGTEFFINVDENSTQLVIYEGQVSASNDRGSLVLVDHEAAIVRNNEAPEKVGIISPTDAVQWALYYPTIIDYQLDEKLSAESAWPELQASIDLYQQGRFFEALAKLDEVPQSARTAHFLNYYAGLLLSVGRVDEAKAAIEQALEFDSDNSDAYALKAIIAVVQNDKEQALNLATLAIEFDQESPTAKLALSYAQQAHFEIDNALASIQEAVKIDTQNVLAWARLTELQMSAGDLDRALESARQAVNLNPTLAKTQTVLGFAHLLKIDTEAAKTIFTQAIILDQADPMPRLGLGLALIREGELEVGRIELEIAVSLDPANSLIRSYLGKAYFEEKRYPLASTQFDMAKERDPYDPTPWFYDAIQKQTQNRPVEALQDIQKSIELNDNRAVYRSKLLLDQDQAGRGSSLARIYDNLGFEKRALMETAKSLSYDPSNHSAHRFLSDAYTNIPRHEIARVSELLQAQLLQPINVNPVQPHLAVADLNIITNTGPAAVGFNEFAPLLERNRPQLVASGIVGSNSTFGNEIVYSQLYEKTSVSLGQFHYQSDGFRPNNGQNHDVLNAFIQHAFTPKFNVQAEVRTRETEHGDLLLDFDLREENNFGQKNFDPNFRRILKEDIARIGARYALSPNQDVLVSAKYINRIENLVGNTLGTPGFQVEAQHLFRERYFNSILGGSVHQFRWNQKSGSSNFKEFNRENVYAYTNTNFPSNLTTTLGLSYDSFTSTIDGSRTDKINPKFGLQWNIFDNLRLRAAWFETTKSHLVAQQSLEQTQVAGFNQFFDDTNGTRARRVGIGMDSRFSNNFYSGIEISERNLDVPVSPAPSFFKPNNKEVLQNQKEQLLHAYFYWLPSPYWAFRGEFQYEKFSRDHPDEKSLIIVTEPIRVQTMSVPFSIEYFHPSGFFSKFIATFIEQNLTRRNDKNQENGRDPEKTNSGVDAFFLLDSIIGYRLSNRRGILSLEGKNLLNENFFYRNINFYQSEAVNPRFIPTRTFFCTINIKFLIGECNAYL